MNLPVPRPPDASPSAAEKALHLWRRLGLSDPALDELLALPQGPPGPDRRAAPRAEAARVLDELGASGEALQADAQLAAAAARLRLLLGAREVLLRLAAECEAAAALLAGSLERAVRGLALGSAAPLRPVVRAARDRRTGRRFGVLRLR